MTPSARSGKPDRSRRDEEGHFPALEQRSDDKPKQLLDRKSPIQVRIQSLPPEGHHQRPGALHVAIETIPNSQQRYPTVGDWQVDKAGNLHITVSRMSRRDYEFLVATHEMVEAYLALHAGVTQQAVDRFDKAYEAKRQPGDDSEPGDHPRAPYHHQHVVASKIEHMLANELGVDWTTYDREVSSK